MSTRPAELIGAKSFGTLQKGETANLIVVDINRTWIVKKEEIISKSKNSCFIGKTFKGKVLKTFCLGKLYSFEGKS
jgi:dihydroorotase